MLQVCNKGARIGSTEGVLLVAAGELDAHLITVHAQVRDGGAVDLEVTHDVVLDLVGCYNTRKPSVNTRGRIRTADCSILSREPHSAGSLGLV